MKFKNLAITIVIAIACMSVAVWAKTSRSTSKVQQWEYNVHSLTNVPAEQQRVQFLNSLGQEGWELVGVDDGRAYLKRPKN